MATTLAPPRADVVPGRRWSGRIFEAYQALARRQALACLTVCLLTMIIRVAMLPWFPIPRPEVHDELSYLLAADTYASGRLANPPHAFPEHFDTYHVLQSPTYSSKYPALQGLVLAAGQKLTGIPWTGVVIATGLACAALCWMLQGWTTPNLALLGALLFMLRVGVFSYWMNSYWGGSVAAIGGALTLGALARLGKGGPRSLALVWAAGLAILMHSRPADGVLLGATTAVALVWWLRKLGMPYRTMALRIAPPALAVLSIAAAAVAYNDYRVTGHALTVPYQLYDQRYIMAPMFLFQHVRPKPHYGNPQMHDFFAIAQVSLWKNARADLVSETLTKFSFLYDFFFGLWPLLIPPLIWPFRMKTTEERLTVAILAIYLAFLSTLIAVTPHYAAAVAGLFYVRFLQSMGRLYDWRPWGKPIGFAAAVFFVTLFLYQFGMQFWLLKRFGVFESNFAPQRAAVIKTLDQQPGNQLVMVRYAPGHDTNQEWVYNRADIDASRIVWARELTPAEDRPFLQHYRGQRKIWLLEPDQSPPRLVPYPTEREATQ